jgi:hypothetical protein
MFPFDHIDLLFAFNSKQGQLSFSSTKARTKRQALQDHQIQDHA